MKDDMELLLAKIEELDKDNLDIKEQSEKRFAEEK
jgi:hypothetical protein